MPDWPGEGGNHMNRIAIAVAAAAFVTITPTATAAEGTAISQAQFVASVDECLAANVRSEFDAPDDVLSRVGASCEFSATLRFPARNNPILGDLLQYDAAKGAFVWNPELGQHNRFHGGGLSPYTLAVSLDASGRMKKPELPAGVEEVLKGVGNADFWMLPVFQTFQVQETYSASNAFGVDREVLKVRKTRYGIATHIPSNLYSLLILEAPVPSQHAREIADRLDIAVTFKTGQVCDYCYKATTLERGQRPTVTSPIDEEVTTHVVFVNVVRIDVIDRQTGQVVFASVPAGS
jgi:hypothetical protein